MSSGKQRAEQLPGTFHIFFATNETKENLVLFIFLNLNPLTVEICL